MKGSGNLTTGIILLSHGSRLPEARLTVRSLVEMLTASHRFAAVGEAYLQFNQPDLPAAVAAMATAGIKRIIIMPFLFYQGMHMKRDLPVILRELHNSWPDLEIKVAPPIGAHPKLVDIIIDRVQEV